MRNKKLFALIPAVAMILCAAFLLTACGGGNGSPRAAFNLLISGKAKQDVKKVTQACFPVSDADYDKYIKNNENGDEFKKSDSKVTIKVKSFSATIDGDKATATATVSVKAKYLGKQVSYDKVELSGLKFNKKDGKWYVDIIAFEASYLAGMVKAAANALLGG